MTMTETQIEKPAAPKRKRKARKSPRRASFQKPSAKAEFAGLTATTCCNACNPDGCVISGINVCAHPFKGGLQSAQLGQHETVKRFDRAKRVLAGQKINV
jgi:hypothetical protein